MGKKLKVTRDKLIMVASVATISAALGSSVLGVYLTDYREDTIKYVDFSDNSLSTRSTPVAGVSALLADSIPDYASIEVAKSEVVETAESLEEVPEVTDVSYKMYVTDSLNVRENPDTESEVIGYLNTSSEITVVGEVADSDFVQINYQEQLAYIHSSYLSEEKPEPRVSTPINYAPSDDSLNAYDGTNNGPSGKETYYNLDMSSIVARLKRMGIEGEYWVRDDGVKMYGNYVMVAANLSVHPRGSLVETSLGTGIVCDTGGFAKNNPNQLDIATAW